MFKSNYKEKTASEITDQLKKKLLKSKSEEDAPTVEELDAEIEGNKPAYTKKQVDESNDYKNKEADKVTGGNYQATQSAAPIAASVLEGSEDRTVGNKIADGAVAGAGGVLDMASSVMMQKGDMNKKERKANTLNMATKGLATGASIGTAVGGPYGAAIGAGVGLVAGVATGLIQGAGDQKRLDAKAARERVVEVADIKDKRKKAQLLSDGKANAEKSQDLLKSQMGMLGSKYSTSKLS